MQYVLAQRGEIQVQASTQSRELDRREVESASQRAKLLERLAPDLIARRLSGCSHHEVLARRSRYNHMDLSRRPASMLP